MDKKTLTFIKLIFQLVVSIIVLIPCLLFVFEQFKYNDEGTKKWAYGMIGTILGYWLK